MGYDPEKNGIRVAVFGATGSVGADLIATLEESALPIQEVRPVASRVLSRPTVAIGGRDVRVHPMPPTLDTSPLIEGIDLVVFATPPEVTARPPPCSPSGACAP